MKLDPGFTSHWKTERLLDRLGGDGVVALLRLWGMAQIRRKWNGLPLNAERLAAETRWKGDPEALWIAFTDPLGPWLDSEEGGTWAIHDFHHHQKQVVSLWENGKRGGRPSKNKKEEEYTSSSSSPISFANENQMVFNQAPCTIEQAQSAGRNDGLLPEQVRLWWELRSRDGWAIHKANGSTVAITKSNWRNDLATAKGWKAQDATKPKIGARADDFRIS